MDGLPPMTSSDHEDTDTNCYHFRLSQVTSRNDQLGTLANGAPISLQDQTAANSLTEFDDFGERTTSYSYEKATPLKDLSPQGRCSLSLFCVRIEPSLLSRGSQILKRL